MKTLPFTVHAFGVCVAAFNSINDAEDWAMAQSGYITNGWFIVYEDNKMHSSFSDGEEVRAKA